MARSKDGFAETVTVRGCWPAARPEGATALVLDTIEVGPIAFVLSPEAIAGIRQALADAEALMSRGVGRA